MIVLRAINDEGVKVDLDLRQDVDLKMDISAIENTQIGSLFGVSTQTFALPDTNKNNTFFGNLYNLGATPSVALQDSIDAQLLYNGVEIMTGKLYIVDITTNQRGKTFYNVNLVNETIDFRFKVENRDNPYLAGLDWSDYSHDYTYANITSSWADGLLSGDIIYPHINYGTTEDSTEAEYAFGGQVGKIDNSATPLEATDFKPAIRVKAVLDKIFDSVDYTYSSSFFDSATFNDLYLLTTATEQKGANGNQVSGSFYSYASLPHTGSSTDIIPIEYNTESFDNANNYNPSTYKYTAGVSGFHRFVAQIGYSIINESPLAERVIRIIIEKNGTQVASYPAPHLPAQGSVFIQYNDTLTLADEIQVFIEFVSDAPTEKVQVLTGSTSTYFKGESPASVVGTSIDMGAQIPAELSIMDFLEGLIQKFNLVIEPKQNERNTLIIEPYEEWLEAGTTRDWTDKVDRDISFSIKHPITEQPKTIIFSDEEDEDMLNVYHKETRGKVFGEYVYKTDSDLANGERRVGKVFAPTPTKGIAGGQHFIIPQLCKKEESGKTRPFRFKPRLLQKIGLTDVNATEAKGIDGANASAGTYYIFDEIANDAVAHTQYFAVGALSAIDANQSTDTTLHYGGLNHYPFHQKFANGYVNQGAFDVYWSRYLNSELYDIDSRKLTLNVVLNPTEYFDFQLNDNIFIDGAYYRINKINGANLAKEASIAIELIKIIKRRIRFPRKKLNNGDVISIDTGGASPDGYVQIINQDGIVVSGSEIGGYANEQGFVYNRTDEKVIWNINQSSVIQPTQVVQGNSKIDDNATNIIALGTDNLVQQSNNNFISGELNVINENVENSAILGAKSSSLSDSAVLSTIIGGNETIISGSNISTAIGARIQVEGGSENVVIGNGGVNQTYTIKDLDNVVVINPTRDLESIENLGGDDLPNYAYFGSYRNIGGIFSDFVDLEVSDGGNTSLTGDDAKDTYTYFVDTSGSSPFTTPHEIHLPSTSAGIPAGGRDSASGYKRELRFIVKDTSLQSGDVRLVPSGSDVINGTIFWNLGSAYSTLSIYGRDGAWYLV